jgi:DNA mismatch endonuclease (patch repair protein)
VFSGKRKVIFVHGCFWHHHAGCVKASMPKTRTDYWSEKFRRNRQRDDRAIQELGSMGWSALTIWECETRNIDDLRQKLKRFLDLG